MSLRNRATEPGRRPSGVPHAAPPGPADLRFSVSPRLVLGVGLPMVLLLAVASVVGQLLSRGMTEPLGGALFYYVPLTALDGEGGIPAWYSSVLLLACAAALWTVGAEVRAAGRRWAPHWWLLAAGFVYLSLDEMASLHELAGPPLRAAFGLSGAFYYAWTAVAVPVVVVLALLLLPFMRALPRDTLRGFLVSGVLYVGGAIGVEMIGGLVAEGDGQDTTAYLVAHTVEEVCELLGITLFLAAVSRHRLRHVVAGPTPA